MIIHRFTIALFLIISVSVTTDAQYYNGESKVIKKAAVTIDSIALVNWPTYIPKQAKYNIDPYDLISPTQVVGSSFVIPIGRTMNPKNRSYVGVYYSSKADWTTATLYKRGLGITQLKVPIAQPGYYYAVVIGPIGDFVQLYHYDGKIVRNGERQYQDMQIYEMDPQ